MTLENTDTDATFAAAVAAAEAPAEPVVDAVALPADVHDGTAGPDSDDGTVINEEGTI